jgi:hypothetical protein
MRKQSNSTLTSSTQNSESGQASGKFRQLLATLPVIAIRLIVQKHGAITQVPRYNQLPCMEYDQSDRWTVSQKDVDDKPVILLTLERDVIGYENAMNERKRAEALLREVQARINAYDRQIAVANVADHPKLQIEKLALVGQVEPLEEQIALYAERSEQLETTVWEIPASEVV